MDPLTALADSLLNNQQMHSAKIDSISEIATRLSDRQDSICSGMDSIQTQLQRITDYGTGYSDTAAIIAIPLIIALFAFAFTYLFSVVTSINKKFNSEHISRMFKTSLPYHCYMLGSALSVGYIILMAILSLALKETAHEVIMVILNWTSLVVAGGYAAIILWFVHTCLKYDDHQGMLGLIEERYQKEKSNPWAINIRTKRLTDLCLYADRTRNTSLAATVMDRVNELDKSARLVTNKGVSLHTASFYESIVDTFIQSPHDSGAENSLLWNWSQTFRHDQLPYTEFIYGMLGKMVEAVKRGKFSLFEAFMERCSFRYNYINKIPAVCYAKGENEEAQKRAEEECLDTWQELREAHYLAMAHLFTTGHFEVASVLKKTTGSSILFFPSTAAQILKIYANSKEKQDETTGSFFRMSLSINKVIGHNYDIDMLEKFTAMMLLLSEDSNGEDEYLLDDNKRKILEDKKAEIAKYGHLWTQHAELLSLYPTIQDKKIENIIDLAMTRLTKGEILQVAPKKGKKRGEPVKTIFDIKLSVQDLEPVEELFNSLIYSNRGNITDGLNGDVTEGNKDVVPLGIYTFSTSKKMILDKMIWRNHGVFTDMLQVLRSRYFYIVLDALSQMKVKDAEMKWGEFEKMFSKYVGEAGDQYVIMDTNCSVDAMVKMDPLQEGQKWSFHRFYKGAYYYNTTFGTAFCLNDVPLAESYDKTVMIVRSADLPTLESISEDGRPHVSISDESDKEKGYAAVRVTVNPNLVARYNKNAEVIRLRLVKK